MLKKKIAVVLLSCMASLPIAVSAAESAKAPSVAVETTQTEVSAVNINTAEKYTLLRVPGLGPTTVKTILAQRKQGQKVRALADLGRVGKRLQKAANYLVFT